MTLGDCEPLGITGRESMLESIPVFLSQSAYAVVLGVLSSLVVVMFVEWQRKPRLTLGIPPRVSRTIKKEPHLWRRCDV